MTPSRRSSFVLAPWLRGIARRQLVLAALLAITAGVLAGVERWWVAVIVVTVAGVEAANALLMFRSIR